MLYFIPAWYQQGQWSESEQNWYVRRAHTEFDDTVKQIQLFHRSGAFPYQIMLLSFAPNFRHFIHRQSIYHASYWSCFDAIQEIRRNKVMMLSFHDINWPDGIEFIYNPFVIIAMLHGVKYAQIEFGEDGNPIQIDMFQDGKICRRNLYDDRGFVSATIVYEDGKPLFQDYLMENGIRKMRCFMSDGHVEINQNYPNYLILYKGKEYKGVFIGQTYNSIDEVIIEVLRAYIELTQHNDIFCAAMHERHAKVLENVLKDRKLILTFFENRFDINKHTDMLKFVERADYIITDSQDNTKRLLMASSQINAHIVDITPYDSRVDFGISQQLNVQKILVPVDGIEEEIFQNLILYLGQYLLKNRNAQIHLFTRNAAYNRIKELLKKTRRYLAQADMEEQWAQQEQEKISENKLEAEEMELEEEIPIRFFVEQCVDELSVSKCMREQRVIVDMRDVPELYLRIAAISVGIPQIVHAETKFVKHKKNGYILQNIQELPEVLDYYLDGLNNWNEAMIYSYELGKEYTTKVLVEKWKEVIDIVG